MPYLNPFLLLNVPLEDLSDTRMAERLRREKKHWLAEFELQDATEIDISGHQLDKATLLRLLEEMEDPTLRSHHRKIAAQSSLHDFLVEANLDLFYQGDISLLAANSKEFLRFIAPAFADQYNRRLVHALKQHDAEEIEALTSQPLAIPTQYHAAAYQDAYRYLHAHVEELHHLTQAIEAGQAPDGRVQEYCDEMLIDALNALPDYFAGARDRYGLALESLAIEVHNTHKRVQLGVFILQQGLKLHTSEETQRRLQHILDQLKAMSPADTIWDSLTGGGQEKKSDNKQLWWAALGIGALAIVLLRLLK